MQYPGSGPGWRMQRPPRGPPRGGDFGPRFGPPRGGFGPPPPPWAFRGRGGRARGGPPMRFRGPRPPPPHWFVAQQEFPGQSHQDDLSPDPSNQHNRVEDEATQGETQASPQNKNAPGGTKTTAAVASDGVSAASVLGATTPQRQRSKAPTSRPGEHEPAFDESLVLLDWYNSDLNLDIDCSDYCSVKARSSKGFGLMWAGVKATYGATRGKVCFEVSITGNNDVSHLENEPNPHVLRCGWSASDASMQLGEEDLSWGYGGTGKKSVGCKFVDYGVRFGVGDILGCYLDFSNDPVVMKYTVNGKDKGIAYRLYQRELKGRALFPHVLTKNQNFSVNFGQMPSPLMPLLPGFVHIGQLDVSDGLVRGPTAPAEGEQCEVLMMIGLPGAGKTHWASGHAKSHPEKQYNILGTNSLIDRMKVQGLPRKRNYSGRWEALIEMCTNCFNELIKVASKRRRNYIIDQTNVFPTARFRKMEPFRGMTIKIVVVVPDDAEYKRRVSLREAEEGKEVPDSAVHNMKANFVLPEIEETFATEVLYTELPPNEASNLVTRYNLEAEAMGVSQQPGVRNFVKKCTVARMKLGATNVIGRHVSDTTGYFRPTAAAEFVPPSEIPMECSSSSISTKTEAHQSRSVSKSSVNSPVVKTRPAANRNDPAKKGSETDSRDGEEGDKGDSRSKSRQGRRSSRRSRSRGRSDSRNRGRERSRSPRKRRKSNERQGNNRSSTRSFGDKKSTIINPWAFPEEQQVLQHRASEDVSMRLLKESLGGSGGDGSKPSRAMDITLARHGSDGDRRRNKSGGDGGFRRGNGGGGVFGSATREGRREDEFTARDNPFGGVGNRPDFNRTEGFGSHFQSVGMEDNRNHGNLGPGNGGRESIGQNRGRGGGRSFSEQHGGVDDRQESVIHRGSEFGLDSTNPGGSILSGPQTHERPVPNQGQRNWAGPGNDRPPFWNWDQGCNASGSQLQLAGPGPESSFGQSQLLGRGRGLARPGPQHGSRGNFNSGGNGGGIGMGRGKFGQFEGNDGRSEFDQEQRTGNIRGHYDDPRMEGFPRADGRGSGVGDGGGFHRGPVPDGTPTRSGQESSEHGKRDGNRPGPHSASGRTPQQTRTLQVPDQNRRSWSDGHDNRPFSGPHDHMDNGQHQGGPPQRPVPQGDIGSVGQPQPSSIHFDEHIGVSRGGPSFGQISAAMGPAGGHPNSGPQTSTGNKGLWPLQGGSMSNEGGPRQSGTEWSRAGPPFNRSHDPPQQGTLGAGDVDVGGQRGPPWNQRGASQSQPKSQPTSQRGPESGSFHYPPGREPFGGPEHSRAHLHQGDVQQSSAPPLGSGLGNRGYAGSQEGLGRPAHSETDFSQSGLQGVRHPPPRQDAAGPSTHFGGHSTGSNLGTDWNRGGQTQVQETDPPSESMQDLIRRSKQFQSQRRQSPDREQFMNPPNPNATPPSGGGGGGGGVGNAFNPSSQGASTSSVVTDTSGAPAPDYKALLQYLQFYQKQMGGENSDNK